MEEFLNNIPAITAAIIALIGSGGIGAMIAKFRAQKRLDKNQDVKNYQTIFNTISQDVARVREELAAERKEWAGERKTFGDKIDKLTDQVRNQDKALHAKEVEVAELRGQVNLLKSQLDTYQSQQPTAKTVTIKT